MDYKDILTCNVKGYLLIVAVSIFYPAPERSEGAEVLKMAIRVNNIPPGRRSRPSGGAAAP